MKSLRVFGSLDLSGPDGEAIHSVLSQPKRCALLVYLAVARPWGFHRRDTLIGLFWPESNEENARAALSTSLSFLRRSLGDEVILTRGTEEVGLDAEAIQADVWAFEEALKADDPAEALETYRGDLLEGFFLSGSPGFEQWLEEERARLRRAAAKAAWAGVMHRIEEDELAEAEQMGYRGLALGGMDESAVRRLIQALADGGDRAGALRFYDDFSAILQAQTAVEPDRKTHDAVDRIRGATEEGVAKVARMPRGEEVGLTSAVQPGAAARPSVPRSWRIAVVGAAGTLATVGIAWMLSDRASTTMLVPDRIVVLPFENETVDLDLDVLGGIAADWITDGLMRVGLGQVVPSQTALQSIRAAGGLDVVDRASALAEETGAGLVVTGAYSRQRDSLAFRAQIVDGSRRLVRGSVSGVFGDPADPMGGVGVLRDEVLGRLAALLDRPFDDEAVQLLGSERPSYGAYRSYMDGMELFIEARYREAAALFSAAAADSTFLMPLVTSANAFRNLGDRPSWTRVVEVLETRRGELDEYLRHALDWHQAALRGTQLEMLLIARRAWERFPGDAVWGWTVAVYAARSNRPAEAVRAFERLDPDRGWIRVWVFYDYELASALSMLGDHEKELEVARRARERFPDLVLPPLMEARALIALDRAEDAEVAMQDVEGQSGFSRWTPATALYWAGRTFRAYGHTDAAEDAIQRAIEWYAGRPPEEKEATAFRRNLAEALYEAGRFNEAEALIEELLAEEPDSWRHRGLLGGLAARRGDADRADEIMDWLRDHPIPHELGLQTATRARMAGLLGHRDEAAELFRQAAGQPGFMYGPAWFTDFDLDPIRHHPVFEDVLRPRG